MGRDTAGTPIRTRHVFTTTGRQLYVIGDIDGGFRPRSNPYDLHTFGQPQADDPLADRLQGIKGGKVIDMVETTSKNAGKAAQMAKENRILESGGRFIRDRTTGQIVPIGETPIRLKQRY